MWDHQQDLLRGLPYTCSRARLRILSKRLRSASASASRARRWRISSVMSIHSLQAGFSHPSEEVLGYWQLEQISIGLDIALVVELIRQFCIGTDEHLLEIMIAADATT
jgi:hypothetical protein